MASVTLPGRMVSGAQDEPTFLFLSLNEGGVLGFNNSDDISDALQGSLGGVVLESGTDVGDPLVASFCQQATEALLARFPTLPAGVSLRVSADTRWSGSVRGLNILLEIPKGLTTKEFRKISIEGKELFRALRYHCRAVDSSSGLLKVPSDLRTRAGYEVQEGGKVVKKDRRLSISAIKNIRERLTHYLLQNFSASNRWHAVSGDSFRPAAETKALIDAVAKFNKGSLASVYRSMCLGPEITSLALPDADKALKKPEHRKARADLLEVLEHLRKKVPVSKRTRPKNDDDDDDDDVED